jgi:uncharacterized protein (DUF983 family)
MAEPLLRVVEPLPLPRTFDPAHRGYVVTYRAGLDCPGCGRSQWWVGRVSAECAWCGTAVGFARPEQVKREIEG